MEENKEICLRVLTLADTTAEGLEHIYNLTMNGRFEETAELYTDVAESFHEMQLALQGCSLPAEELNTLEQRSGEVITGMKLMLAAYEGDRDVRPMVVLQFALLPAYRSWRDVLREQVAPRCSSSMH